LKSSKVISKKIKAVPSKNTPSPPPLLWLILAVAFLVKAFYLWFSKESPFYEPILLDPGYYHKWALKILGGDFIGQGVFYGLPLYPFFLALCYKIFDSSLLAVKWVQASLGLLTIFFVYKSAEKISNSKTALLATCFAALYGPLFFHEGILIPEALSLPLYAAAFYAACLFWDEPTVKKGIGFGIMAGLAALTKTGIILFVVVFATAVLFRPKRRITALAILLLAFFGTLLPVTLHNIIYGKDMVFLTSHSGFNFYIGNNPKAEGVFVAPEGTGGNVDAQMEDSKAVAEKETGRELKPSEVSRYWSDKAWEFIWQSPGQFLKLCGRKLLLFFDAREISDVDDYAFSRNFIPFLRFPWLTFAFLGPLALAGLGAGWGNLKYRPLVYMWVGSYCLGIVAFFVNARYRLPLLGIFFPIAAFAVTDAYERLRSREWAKIFLYVVFLAVGIWVTQAKLVGTNWVRDIVNAGDVYQEKKDFDRAAKFYKKALEIDPGASKASLAMAIVYTKTGRYDEAKEYYLRSIAADSNNPTAYNNLGLWYDREGNPEVARDYFLKAIDLKPGFAQAHNNLGMVYGKMGENAKALSELDISLKLNPISPRTYTNRGLVLHRLGQQEEAVKCWKKALEIDPDFREARRALEAFSR